MNAFRRTLFTVVSSAALLVGACSSTTSDGGSETNWVACDDDSPCAAGFTCTVGFCKPASPDEGGDRVASLVSGVLTLTGGSGPPSTFWGHCLSLSVDVEDGRASCTVIEVTDGACDCAGSGRAEIPASELSAAKVFLQNQGVCDVGARPSCESQCLCALPQLEGADRTTCQNEHDGQIEGVGWCYAEPAEGLGDPSLVSGCANPAEQRTIRFMVTATPGTRLAYSCIGRSPAAPLPGGQAPLGASCLPGDLADPEYPGFSASEVTIETGGDQCASEVCLVAYFEGRPGCPYGHFGDQQCMTSGPDPVLITAERVEPQLVDRSPDDAVYCSCRCDGPGPGPFCECPGGFSCEPLFPDLAGTAEDLHGSYCVKEGTLPADPSAFVNGSKCVSGTCDGR